MRSRIAQRLQRLGPTSTRPATARPERTDRPGPAADAPAPPRAEAPAPAPAAVPPDPEARVREAGGPNDRATYTCACGMVFAAPVSTSVSCPHCGTDQAW